MPKQYPEEFKKQVVSFCLAGNSLPVASKKYKLAQSTLYRWCKENVSTENQFAVRDCTAIRRQCERLEHILQIIRLSNLIEEVPRRKRLEILASFMSSLNSTASMSYVKLWLYLAEHSIITFFAERIEQNTC